MQQLLSAFLFSLFALSATAQAGGSGSGTKSANSKPIPTNGKQVKLICNIVGVASPIDSLVLYEYAGYGAHPVQKVLAGTDGAYTFVMPSGPLKFYAVGFNENGLARVVLSDEPEVKLWANVTYMDRARTLGSVHNAALEKVVKRMGAYQNMSWNDPVLHTERIAFIDSLKQVNSPLWRTANLLQPPFFQGNNANNEAEYYGLHWFDHSDFKDRAYDKIPDVYYAFSAYANKVMGMASEADFKKWSEAQLSRIPAGSGAYRLALGGLVKGLQQRQAGALYIEYIQKYVDKYKNDDNGEMAELQYELSKAGTSTPGMLAPDLKGMTLDSATYALSDMKGKVVLVDFWASWCGPCRRENPRVRDLYAKYKDQGFDILGVSLDRDYAAWKKAVEQDALTWHHISDLKGWQSGHAALYSITSIPQTVLVDREGKVIVRNLRGDTLAAKLYEIFGN